MCTSLNTNTTGLEWIFAVEIMLVGYKGGIRDCQLTFHDMNPVFRHNLLFAHQVGSKLKYAGDTRSSIQPRRTPMSRQHWVASHASLGRLRWSSVPVPAARLSVSRVWV